MSIELPKRGPSMSLSSIRRFVSANFFHILHEMSKFEGFFWCLENKMPVEETKKWEKRKTVVPSDSILLYICTVHYQLH